MFIRKKIILMVSLYLVGLILVPLLLTAGSVMSIQIDPYIMDGKGRYIEKNEDQPFVCTYGGFPRGVQHDYCDQKEFISNLSNYRLEFIIFTIIYFITSTVILSIIGLWILIGNAAFKIGKMFNKNI